MQMRFYYLALFVVLIPATGSCNLAVTSHDDTLSYTPFMEAAKACDLAKEEEELEKDPHLLKSTEQPDGTTALHAAVAQNCLSVATYLLSEGLEPGVTDNDHTTPLHLAARNGNLEMIRLLLKWKAEVNALDSDGRTPLDRAKSRGHQNAVDLLRQNGGHEGAN